MGEGRATLARDMELIATILRIVADGRLPDVPPVNLRGLAISARCAATALSRPTPSKEK